eukprot:1247212-Rhodomonas_salina.1
MSSNCSSPLFGDEKRFCVSILTVPLPFPSHAFLHQTDPLSQNQANTQASSKQGTSVGTFGRQPTLPAHHTHAHTVLAPPGNPHSTGSKQVADR